MDKEIIETKASVKTDVTLSEKKAAQKAAKKRKRFEKKELKRLKKEHARRAAILPASKRPIICPPDCSGAAKKHVAIGIALRIFVIFVAVVGVSLFVSEAFGFDMTADYLAQKNIKNYGGVTADAGLAFIVPWALIFVGAFALALLWKYGVFIAVPVIAASVVITTLPNPVQFIREAALTAYNGALGHMKFMGFYAIDLNQVPVTQTAGTPEELVRGTVILFVLVTAAVFTPCMIKRTRIIAPGIYSGLILTFIFVYNLSRSNWALALIIASFSALIVMYVYDRIFIAAPKPNEVDETDNVFGETEAPELPEHLLIRKRSKEERLAAKKAKKQEKKARRKGKKITVDQEISEYFSESEPKRKKKARVHLTPAEKAKKRADKQAIDRVRDYRANILLRRASVGGFAGAGILLLALLILFIPATSTHSSFETIPAIDEKLEYYREYVTAVLMGDDPSLDLLAFEGDANNFSPRNTLATPRYYTHEPIMTVESNYSSNIYLRGWIATSFNDGLWHTAAPGSETLERYRSLFATNDDASESIYYNFFRIMTDDGIPEEGRDVSTIVKRLEKYGYTIAQVNMKRTEDFDDVILYMPSFHIRAYSPSGISSTGNAANFLRAYGSSEASNISYANYFDGLYTSYRASKQGYEGYAAVSMLPVMKSDSMHYNLANLIAEYNQTRAAVANGRTVIEKNAEDPRLGTFSLTLHDGSVFEYTVISVAEDGTKTLTVKQPVGVALYTIMPDGDVEREMIDVPVEYDEFGDLIQYYAPKLIKAVLYFEYMDSSAQWQFNRQATLLDKYTPYVYETYTAKANSAIISDLCKEIIENAVVKEDYREPRPADFSLAANCSEYKYNKATESYLLASTVTNRDVYVQRHELVMEIIRYLCDEERFTYTLYPAAPAEESSLNGIELFLTQTHEGYCVQFASAAALLLREAGIPARYVEGYIATGFYGNRGEGAVSRYTATVRDSNAHAWIEVWYDGLGWIQYETTPTFYDAMYVSSRPSSGISRPSDGTGDEDEEAEDPLEGLTDYEIQQMLEEQRREALRELIKNILMISLIAIAVITAITVFFLIFLKRARKCAEERNALLSSLFNADEKLDNVPEREEIRKVGEMILNMLRECGFAPAAGEFSADFAKRVASECYRELAVAAEEEGLNEYEAHAHPITESESIRIFDAIAAEEFGNGAPTASLPLMAKLYYRLRATVYRRKVSPWRRMILYLFMRES